MKASEQTKSGQLSVRGRTVRGKPLGRRLRDNWQLYAPVVLTLVYKYIPMYGIQIAFRDFKASRGYLGSEWVACIGLRGFSVRQTV